MFVDLLSKVCNVDDKELGDDDFIRWLASRINKQPEQIVNALLSSQKGRARGRKMTSDEVRQMIFNTWHAYSIVTVDRRNGQDQVKMKEMEFILNYKGLILPDDIEIVK